MRRRTIIKSSALLSLSALTTGVFSGCTASNLTNNATTSQNLRPLRVGILAWLGWEGLYIADLKKLFAVEGIDVEQQVFKSATEVNDALLAGKLDLAAMTATDLVILNAKIPNMKTIMVTDYSGEVDGILASNKITRPEDLRGKKIAREDVPYEIVFVGEFLKRGGMSEKDVKVVSLSAEDGAKAFVAGEVDAVATYDPFLGKALKQRPDARLLFSPNKTSIIPNSIVAKGQVITERRNDVLAYLRAVDKGLKYSAANRSEVDGLMAKWLDVTIAEVTDQRSKIYVLDIVKNKVDAFNPSSALNVESSIRSGGKILLDNGKVETLVDAATLVDGSLIKSL
jgi:NitT/TauT family transport system substrate-binding protein